MQPIHSGEIKPFSPSKISSVSANLEGMKAQPVTPSESERISAPGEFSPPSFPKQNELSLATAQFKFIKMVDYVETHLTGNPTIDHPMKAMAETLDKHVEKKFSMQLDHDIRHAVAKSTTPLTEDQKTAIEKKVQKKYQDSLTFFITVDKRKNSETPLERMGTPFAFLTPSSENDFLEGASTFASLLAILAFEQHRENPEQYVSHGFDHSINVANYTRDVLNMNPKIVDAMAKKYNITKGEAVFLLENVALLHDCGYPCVGCRAKAVHGISGADLILPMQPLFAKVITSQGADIENLFNDFRNAIMFHSADKIESTFGAKIHTTMGTFLTDPKNIVNVLSNFYDPAKSPSNTPRYALEIFVQNSAEKIELEVALQASQEEFQQRYGSEIILPKVNIHSEPFKGRFADLQFNKDKLIGLEYSITDLLENPLNMIRLVDNMDMRQTRLTLTQNEPAFREIYARLGDQWVISQLAIELEDFEREMDKKMQNIPDINQKLKKELSEEIAKDTQQILSHYADLTLEIDSLENQVKIRMQDIPLTTITTPKEARDLLNTALIDSIFKQNHWKHLAQETQEDIRSIGMQQSSYDFRHFGGTEAIKEVQLKAISNLEGTGSIPCVVITVNREHFEDLNKIKVNEEGILIGIGEYQIWRASDAYKSIALGNTKINLQVVDEHGQQVICIIDK